MDQTPRCRCKIWLVLCVFFICWYFMIHNAKWYNLSTFQPETSPVEIIETTQKTTHSQTDNEPVDWLHDTAQLRALENELEPILKKIKPKPEKKDKGKEKKNETNVEKVSEKLGKIRYRNRRTCSGRYIYMYDLPSRFNDDILDDCQLFNKWQNICPFIDNSGMGPNLENPQRVFSKSGWYATNQFMLEPIFHNRMKNYDCLTNESSVASAIYVPYYAGLDVWRYLFDHNVSTRDALAIDLAEWLREQPEWKPYDGKNHFIVAGRVIWEFRREVDEDEAWGNKLMLLPEFKNMTTLTIEKSPWHSNNFGIPYPTYFHPKSDNDIAEWQGKMRRHRRRALFSFAGAPRPDMEDSYREEIIQQCIDSTKCRIIRCSNENLKCYQPIDVMKLFQNSVFCLQPPGDSFTRRSTFDSILAGCIPVFFNPGSAYVQYLWHLPKEFDKYSVLINEDDVRNKNVSIEHVLSRISARKVAEMRIEVIRLIPTVVYADPKSKLERFKDAFDVSVSKVLDVIENVTNKTTSYEFDERLSWKYFLFGSVEKHDWDHYFRYSMTHKAKQADLEGNESR
ncbi:xyloglucan galactosyltransferase KATAMARI1 homolog [Bidens hawaiensis]|uniref:xyloglucan galactosyltransferase KATAMARI1 homolog n=1 Tax=Bidens hawaiensis TaxID=980011 RepID=UPI004049BD8B